MGDKKRRFIVLRVKKAKKEKDPAKPDKNGELCLEAMEGCPVEAIGDDGE